MRLAGKVALVTGASRGIGRAIAIRLTASGAVVAVHYGSGRVEAEATTHAVEAAGGSAVLVQADLAAPGAGARLAADLGRALSDRFGSPALDILRGPPPYEATCRAWTDDPSRFRYDPTHFTSGLNTKIVYLTFGVIRILIQASVFHVSH
ncbi:SDR family NAD(P)-dependent oxidoreductase [uncultured Methylobacterium sp.]|uniref:SDR family NAD(P)-dependent oxidoreductase n=1 Tax=uncultured Methylobacterium sp. TaxID=157278 RepID=UPI0035CAA995